MKKRLLIHFNKLIEEISCIFGTIIVFEENFDKLKSIESNLKTFIFDFSLLITLPS